MVGALERGNRRLNSETDEPAVESMRRDMRCASSDGATPIMGDVPDLHFIWFIQANFWAPGKARPSGFACDQLRVRIGGNRRGRNHRISENGGKRRG